MLALLSIFLVNDFPLLLPHDLDPDYERPEVRLYIRNILLVCLSLVTQSDLCFDLVPTASYHSPLTHMVRIVHSPKL